EDGDVGLGRDVHPHRVDETFAPLPGQAVQHGGPGCLQRRQATEFGDRVVAQAVQADVQELFHLYFMIRANSWGSRLAPPTRAPSISGCAMNSRTLPALTLPPYWIRTAWAASAVCRPAMVLRIRPITSPASAASALRPVPIAQMGS